ncbi:MAG: von Willebrand factor type A domain-containing protein [Paludibacter sp.]|nr:von Willebrand factor type A domain-containing protein [Paludibacter sp.]
MKQFKIMLTISLLFIALSSMQAQNLTVNGKVTDSQQNPIQGAVVTEKGTTNGTVTGLNGEFSLKTSKGKTLVIKMIGYKTAEIVVNKTSLHIILKEDPNTLNEFVICNDNVSTALQGQVSGISTKNKTIRIRGVGFTGNTPRINPIYGYTEGNTEEYQSFKENLFIPVSSEALSTFSLDVDAASYSNVRRMINQGQLPDKNAVRVEEMINYFNYDYPQPKGKDPVSITTETADCPWNPEYKLVRIGVKAREISSENLPASNFVFLIDVSGSMQSPNKLELIKSSLKLLINNLRNKDRVAIVTYAGAAGEALPSTSGSDKQKIKDALEQLTAGGSTAGGAGIELAYKIAEKNFIKSGNNRIILCTDGDFNVGISSNEELENMIETKRKTGIYLTVLGYGMGNYKDSKLQTLAEKGNGNHAYIDNIQEANKVLVSEFGSTMYTVAKDVKIQVEFNPAQVSAYRLVGYESRLLNKEDFNDDTKDAGELGAGHTVTALYEVIPAGVKNKYGGVDDLKYQETKQKSTKGAFSDELMTVKLRYKLPDSDTSSKMEIPVLVNSNQKMSEDFSFAAAVAMFGQLLRDSDFKGEGTYRKVIELARQGLDKDENGYRREFIRLVESVEGMAK